MDVAPQISDIFHLDRADLQQCQRAHFRQPLGPEPVGIHDGDTIVIGGLMQDQKTQTVSKVPILGDIPGLGIALSAQSDRQNQNGIADLSDSACGGSGESAQADHGR
jgi:hypothetical protein